MCNIYSYMRISTEEERGLQKFTRQESAITKICKGTRYRVSVRVQRG